MRLSVFPAGWTKITAPSSSALAQNGRSRSSPNSTPFTWDEMMAPRRSRSRTQRSSSAAESATSCSGNEASPTSRSGWCATGCIHLLEPQRHVGHALEQRLGHAARSRQGARVLRMFVGQLHHFRYEDVGVYIDDGGPWSWTPRSRRFGRCACELGRFGTGGSLGCAPRPLAPLD